MTLTFLKEKPEFKAKKCTLVGVHPTGTTNGEWSSLAKDLTKSTLNDNYVHVEFRVLLIFDLIFSFSTKELIILFLKSSKKPDDSYDTCIYIDTKRRCEFTYNDSETKEFVRFAEILNSKGLAFLEEKTQSINMLLADRNALKERYLLLKEGLNQSYITKPILPQLLNRNCLQKHHETLVTHVDIKSEVVYLHFFKVSCFKLSVLF